MIHWLQKLKTFFALGIDIGNNLFVDTESRDSYIVTFQGRKLRVNAELRGGKPSRVIYLDDQPRWLPPNENAPLSQETYRWIIDAVADHLRKCGADVVIEQ